MSGSHRSNNSSQFIPSFCCLRYILTHPDQCKNMHMLPKRHPSGRHSDVDWSKPDIARFPNFQKVQGGCAMTVLQTCFFRQ